MAVPDPNHVTQKAYSRFSNCQTRGFIIIPPPVLNCTLCRQLVRRSMAADGQRNGVHRAPLRCNFKLPLLWFPANSASRQQAGGGTVEPGFRNWPMGGCNAPSPVGKGTCPVTENATRRRDHPRVTRRHRHFDLRTAGFSGRLYQVRPKPAASSARAPDNRRGWDGCHRPSTDPRAACRPASTSPPTNQ